jgi:repressor LexA
MSKNDNQSYKSHSLAPVQRQTLEFLRGFISDHGFAPTLKDICNSIGVRSPSTAHFHLGRLENKGFIKRGDDGSYELLNNEEMIPIMSGPCAVPLLGLIAAGSPIEAIEDTSVTVDVPPQFMDGKGEIYCLQVTGDSMIDAHIMDGDIIIVKKQEVANDGEIVVALLEDGGATLKTFRRLKGGKVMLIPHNPNHKPLTVDKVDIQGKMIGLLREFN